MTALKRRAIRSVLRVFQVLAYAEGGLLPTILLVAIYHWLSGNGKVLVAIVGATHGTVFTAYILIVPLVAKILRWPWRTTSVAFSVAFIPFATWAFERKIRQEIIERTQAGPAIPN